MPLTKHAPRRLVTAAEQLKPPKWQPEREWRTLSTRPADAVESASAPAVPLRGFSPRVVEQCARDAEAAEPEVALTRVAGGGWAAELSVGPRPPAPAVPRPVLADDEPDSAAAWALEAEVANWSWRAAAQHRRHGTLALVDNFLGGQVAEGFLPVRAEAASVIQC